MTADTDVNGMESKIIKCKYHNHFLQFCWIVINRNNFQIVCKILLFGIKLNEFQNCCVTVKYSIFEKLTTFYAVTNRTMYHTINSSKTCDGKSCNYVMPKIGNLCIRMQTNTTRVSIAFLNVHFSVPVCGFSA